MDVSQKPAVIPGNPLRLAEKSIGWQAAALLFGTLFLAACSFVEIPMVPVPVTMQTFGVLLVGALYGWRLGGLTIVAWLAEAAVGLPVLAGGAGGIVHFAGPTAGYLLAFPFCGALTGWLAERGWNGARPLLAFVAMLLGNALCLALGAAWLAVSIGASAAVVHGVLPFLIGGVLKSALGAATLALMKRRTARFPAA